MRARATHLATLAWVLRLAALLAPACEDTGTAANPTAGDAGSHTGPGGGTQAGSVAVESVTPARITTLGGETLTIPELLTHQ